MQEKPHRIVLCLLLILSGGCAGRVAVDESLYPAMDLSWPGVRADAERGPGDAGRTLALDQFGGDLVERDSAGVVAGWPAVRLYAVDGILHDEGLGRLGPTVAEILRARLDAFEGAVDRLRNR